MGREIRMVPKGWEHPMRQCEHSPWAGGCNTAKRNGGMCYRPLYDEDFEAAARKWKEGFAAWERGEYPEHCSEESRELEYWEYAGGPPDRDYYRPKWSEEEATCFQVYETVSEGTPVSPVFETEEEVVQWLIRQGHSEHAAREFVKHKWAPSGMAYVPEGGKGGVFASGVDTYDLPR